MYRDEHPRRKGRQIRIRSDPAFSGWIPHAAAQDRPGRRDPAGSGGIPGRLLFQHSGAQYFDLGGGFHYSGSYPMVFQHSGGIMSNPRNGRVQLHAAPHQVPLEARRPASVARTGNCGRCLHSARAARCLAARPQ